MTKVWQFPDGRYIKKSSKNVFSAMGETYVQYEATFNIEEAQQFSGVALKILTKQMGGLFVDYEEPLIMTGAEIYQAALEEWTGTTGFNNDKESWTDYWHGALGQIKPNCKYKTDGEFSYFEEVPHED